MLHLDCTALSQSQSSNFFMCITKKDSNFTLNSSRAIKDRFTPPFSRPSQDCVFRTVHFLKHINRVFFLSEPIENFSSLQAVPQSSYIKRTNTYMLFAVLGRSVLGKTVPEVLSKARGRRLRAVLKTKGTVFPNTDRPRTANNVFIFFLRDCFKSNFFVEFFIKEIQLKSGLRARIRKKSKMSFFALRIHNCYMFTTLLRCYKKLETFLQLEISEWSVTRGPDGKIRTAGARAISQYDWRIQDSGPLRRWR